MSEYESLRQEYKPEHIKWLLIAESPPPPASFGGSRHFYRAMPPRPDDRLFTNTMRALYLDAEESSEELLEKDKELWLRQFQADGYYMIEALEESQVHEVTKSQRQAKIKAALPRLIERVGELAEAGTKIILIKSNPFQIAAEPLRQAGFEVLNQALVDYPGQWNETAYRHKLRELLVRSGWQVA